MDHFNNARKHVLLPGTLNTDKVFGTSLNYKDLSEYMAIGVGMLYILGGASAVMGQRMEGALFIIVCNMIILMTKDNPFAKGNTKNAQIYTQALKNLATTGGALLMASFDPSK